MSRDDEFSLYRWAAKGDEAAAAFLLALTDAAHVWDDVVDGDVPLDRAALDGAFRTLVLLPADPFYRAHRERLEPIVLQAAINWQAATAIERAGGALHVAYILRSAYIDLISAVALLTGGAAWAVEVSRTVRTINHTETFDDYLEALAREASARGEG